MTSFVSVESAGHDGRLVTLRRYNPWLETGVTHVGRVWLDDDAAEVVEAFRCKPPLENAVVAA